MANSGIETLAKQVTGGTMTRSQAIQEIVTTALGRAPTATELGAIVSATTGAASDLDALVDVAVAVCSTTEFVAR